MKIDIAKDTVIILAAWATVLGFLFALFGQMGEMRAVIVHLQEDTRELRGQMNNLQEANHKIQADIESLQESNRELRQLIISHLVEFHTREKKVSFVTDESN